MVDFLIKRPIAVSMSFLALVILGIIATTKLPVSLLPDIPIPKITVEVEKANTSAREIEDAIVKPLRQQLMQVSHLRNIKSETRNSKAIIELEFNYGTNIDYAFIEVNEKIDRALQYLPRDLKRPKVIKASASDIPVFYLNIKYKKDNSSKSNFLELSRFASAVIRKRIEQLPEIAMVDMSGLVYPEIILIPDENKMKALGLNTTELANILKSSNLQIGSLVIRNGLYTYNMRLGKSLHNIEDIKNLPINIHGRIFKLEDFCQIKERAQRTEGMILSDGQRAISLAIIKQADSKMQDVEKSLNKVIKRLEKDYPDIDFTVTRNQTKLLDYSISNLGQSLAISAVLAFLVMFLFLKDYRGPLLIGISIPVSLIITMLLFKASGISLNIISLSGLVLGVGMMVDNSIIVIDNITQYNERLSNLDKAIVTGTNEVITPLLSSMLTTCAVFIPLIFAGGIAGALFYDQAMSISIGLFVSFAVSITLLPVYYRLFFNKKAFKEIKFLHKINMLDYARLYEKGYYLVMNNKKIAVLIFFILVLAGLFMFKTIKKSRLPKITKDEIMLYVDWNNNIDIDENKQFCQTITEKFKEHATQITTLIGRQQFMLDKESDLSPTESLIYIKAHSPKALDSIIYLIKNTMQTNFPNAKYEIRDADNIFNILFGDKEANLTAELRPVKNYGSDENKFLLKNIKLLKDSLPDIEISTPAFTTYLSLELDPELLALYKLNFSDVFSELKQKFNSYKVFNIVENDRFVPVIIGSSKLNLNQILASTFLTNTDSAIIPLSKIVRLNQGSDLKTITGGEQGEYIPLNIQAKDADVNKIMRKFKKILRIRNDFEVDFSGTYFEKQKMIKSLIFILLVSVLLLYFILAAQFESFSLPIIVLTEIVIDLFGALLLLMLFGQTLNLMSMIGIVVMTGIVINDSILKIDTINVLMKQGMEITEAIKEGGHRRLKPILMTSLTTIFSLLPFLFFSGLGADLQRPLALAIIGGLTLGTFVSLYYIPLFYYFLKRKKRDV